MEQQIRLMLAEGYKIGAIKLYRDETGATLKQAKDAVEAIEQDQPYERPGEIGQDLESQLTGLLQEGRKIDAIKRFREATGAGLKQAKDAVEAIEQGQPLAAVGKQEDSFEYQLIELLQTGRKIEAIKLFRERTGADLKEAKDAVERIATARHHGGERLHSIWRCWMPEHPTAGRGPDHRSLLCLRSEASRALHSLT